MYNNINLCSCFVLLHRIKKHIYIFKYLQKYIVMVRSEREGQGLTCGYALLPNKEQGTHEMMLERTKAKVGDTGRLERIVTDYEKAVINGVKKIFPSVQHKGCQFHFQSALWKKLGEKGLQNLFYQNVNFQEMCHHSMWLGFILILY